MLNKFYNSDFDFDNVIITDKSTYNFKHLKAYINGAMNLIRNKKQNIVICDNDNFSFLIKFFACIFEKKNIFLLSDIKKLPELCFDYDLFIENCFVCDENYNFPIIDEKNTFINFFTSGSSSNSKIIKKSLYNLIKEGMDLGSELNINKNLNVLSTTTMCHLFGMTFHLMFPLCNGFKIYTPSILFPDNLNIDKSILISTPAFLNTIEKHQIKINVLPEYIITAGSKLDENVFKYIENQTNIIEIYGSTETGVIAHKEHFNLPLTLFKNVNLNSFDDNIEVTSPYIFDNSIKINDKIQLNGRNLIIQNRTDRVLKIYDKRISADELENKLKQNDFVLESFITLYDGKLSCLCALTKQGQNFLLQHGILELKKSLKSYLNSFSDIIPQKWKFIDEIPRNQTGKINKPVINRIFGYSLSLPVILDRIIQENKIQYSIFFYNSCNFFSGHFPNFKILPGVVQIFLAKELANIHFNLDIGQGQWKKIKFSNIIVPDKIIKLSIEKNEKYIEFKFFDDEKNYSMGLFMLDNVFKELQCS